MGWIPLLDMKEWYSARTICRSPILKLRLFFQAYRRPDGAPSFQSERQENFKNVLDHVLACRYLLNNAHPSIEPWIRADRKGVNLLKLLIDGRTLQQSLNSSKIEAKDFFSVS